MSFFLPFSLAAGDRTGSCRISYGAEWGYVASILSGYHYNYFSPDGGRIDERDFSPVFKSNAEVSLHCGCDFSPKWNLSLYVGYAGLADYHHAIPVSLRVTRSFVKAERQNHGFCFVDLGSGVSLKAPVQEIFVGKLGGGYRIALSHSVGLDFIMALRMTYTHPDIYDYGAAIDYERINRNNGYFASLSVGMALKF